MAVAKKDKEEAFDISTLLVGASVRIRFEERVYGSMPKNLDTLKAFSDLPEKGILQAMGEQTGETYDDKVAAVFPKGVDEEQETQERAICAFRSGLIDNQAVLITRDFQIKACIGLAAQTTKLTVKNRGTRPVLREGLQIRPQKVPFMRDGEYITNPDGQEAFVGHVTTMQGRRNIIKVCDFLDFPELNFSVYWVKGVVTHEHMEQLLKFAGKFLGIGSQRRFECGKFQVLQFDPLPEVDLMSV